MTIALVVLAAVFVGVAFYAYIAGRVTRYLHPGPWVPAQEPERRPVPAGLEDDFAVNFAWAQAEASLLSLWHMGEDDRRREHERQVERARRLGRFWLPFAIALAVAWPIKAAFRHGAGEWT